MKLRSLPLVLALGVTLVVAAACSSSSDTADPAGTTATSAAPATTTAADDGSTGTTTDVSGSGETVSFTAEVWADNWFSLTVNGEAVGEDSVPITTERSFNSETIEFEASYPLTIAVVTKDFKEDDTGLEYIGTSRQQMGDGGFIAQITDDSTGEVVAVTDGTWKGLAIQRAPLNTECERSADPETECESESLDEPDGWTDAGFDDRDFEAATIYTAADVQPKDGYEDIAWDPSAQFIWTSDLNVDNTILWRVTVPA